MNPFDWHGPEFLALYVVVFLVMLAIAAGVRWYLCKPEDESPPRSPSLSPYEIAYLSGGEDLVVNAAIARLVHEEALAVDASERKLKTRDGGLPADAPQFERVVYGTVKGDAGGSVASVRSATEKLMTGFRKRLQDLGLLVDEDQARAARLVPLGLMLLVPVFGAIKVYVGLTRDRPVLFLVGLCVVSVIAAFLIFRRAVHRSRRGDAVLARLKEENAAMEFQAGRRADGLSGDDLVLAVGLFGMGILAGGPLGRLEAALVPLPVSSTGSSGSSCSTGWGFWSGCGSTCSSSSCGSSCGGGCGGGCGGCGGGD